MNDKIQMSTIYGKIDSIDCNTCMWCNPKESNQSNKLSKHMCTYYNCEILHKDTPFDCCKSILVPCDICMNSGYKNYNQVCLNKYGILY